MFISSFERSVEIYGNRVALICGDDKLSYNELNSCANVLARALVQLGTGRGHLVGVSVERSLDLVLVLLAVAKTGAGYVPIDPALPAERVQQMIKDADPKLFITGHHVPGAEGLTTSACMRLSVEQLTEIAARLPAGVDKDSNLGLLDRQADIAYVMYTSGSTGRPKGVEVTRGNVGNLLLSLQKEPGCNERDRFLALTTVSFDMAVVELMLPLVSGATCVIAQRHKVKDPTAITTLMRNHKITIMQGTPALWQMLLDSGWKGEPHLEKIFCGGEALSRSLADRLLACGDEIWNMYGPTEATVYASIWKVCADHEIVVGSSISPNVHLYVLGGTSGLSPVSPGSLGELYIGGAGVARGYRNRPDLNSTCFLSNPFHQGHMYRTGDQARMSETGLLSVLGRIDGQVKIRGHRIELGDIEATITEHPDISAAVAVCREERLIAYYIWSTKSPVASRLEAGKEKGAKMGSVLRPWLAARLPAYMVPAFFIEMTEFPVTINGKVDRKKLPDPIRTPLPGMLPEPEAASLELQLTRIWSRVLGHDYVGIDDNFFEIGGDSLRLVRVQNHLEILLGKPVPISKLFEHHTIRTLSTYLASPLPMGNSLAKSPPTQTDDNHLSTTIQEDIAIISTACRLPGGVTTPEKFWDLLEHGEDAITDVPNDRWDRQYDKQPKDSSSSYRGGFIPSIYSYDASFFGISPREARRLDPSQYIMLETCWEGFERAGYTTQQLRGSSTGVFIGTSNILAHNSLSSTAIKDVADLDGYTTTGSAGGTMSGRLSYHFGLEGPTMTIDTACSSSLVATHLASTALRQGECDMAVAGGVSLILNPGLHAEFSRLGGMSPDGRCCSFSADTQGTVWSEGSVVVVLKRLSDAQRDGDVIEAVLRGTAVNHDGRSASLTTPSGSAQERLIRTALKAARLQPAEIDYIEAHGTGTKLGDPIEASALAEVFGPGRDQQDTLLIGSAKSNIGHTQAAAGLVGLLKVVLSLKKNILPRTLHVTEPTPLVDWENANMLPVLQKSYWLQRAGRPRRAGVSAFGIGGTNAHVIVEEAPNAIQVERGHNLSKGAAGVMPFLLSADTDDALRRQAANLRQYVQNSMSDEDSIEDLAYSLAVHRTHFRKRIALPMSSRAELLDNLDSTVHHPMPLPFTPAATGSSAEAPKLAMLFSGQGSEWLGMGRELYHAQSIFREELDAIVAEFSSELEMPLLDVMWAEPESPVANLIHQTDYTQPALFALEVALWRLWGSWGVQPDAVLGHSLGELVAAHVAGIMNLPDACRLVAARGRLMQAQCLNNGSMVSLAAGSEEVATAIRHLDLSAQVDIALYNTPQQTVISGDRHAVQIMAGYFDKRGSRTKTIAAGHAFHSRHVDGMLEDYRHIAETVSFHSPKKNIVSSLDGKLVKDSRLQHAEYWVKQVREPVRFVDSMQTLGLQGFKVFLELGPRAVLCGLGAACLVDDHYGDGVDFSWFPSLSPGKVSGEGDSGGSTIQRSVIGLHGCRLPVDWRSYFGSSGRRRITLPTYAFHRDVVIQGPNHRKMEESLQQPEKFVHDSNEFEIVWHLWEKQSPQLSLSIRAGTWGLLRPTATICSDWEENVTASLRGTGLQLITIEHIRDAQALGGCICLWDSDVDQNVLSQTRNSIGQALEQLQISAASMFSQPLVWITRHAVGIGRSDDDAMKIELAPLFGLMRTARSEHPELDLRLIDLAEAPSSGMLSLALTQKSEPECALRADTILVPRLERIGRDPRIVAVNEQTDLIRPGGAVLITGGTGYLGALVARWLVCEHGVKDVFLISRQGAKAAGADSLVKELSLSGARATVIAADIANAESVRSIMTLFNNDRPLRGVIHAAGIADSGILSSMTPTRCLNTFLPKVSGAWILHSLTQHLDLDVFLMFSSISGVLGMQGLANYAAANSFLDALAYLRSAQGLPATSVAFGTWGGDAGMASRLSGNTVSHLQHFGLEPLTSADGLSLLYKSMVSKRAMTVAAGLDMKRLQNYYIDSQGQSPPLLTVLLEDHQGDRNISQNHSIWATLSQTEPERHADIILSMVRDVVAKTLGFARAVDVDVGRPLQDIGIDSLTAVQMRNHLASLTGLKLSVNIVFHSSNLTALSQSLMARLHEKEASSSSIMTQSGVQTPTSSVDTSSAMLDIEAISRGCLDATLTFDNVAQGIKCPSTVFLTGATGFVGSFILYELLRRGITTHCLIRARSISEGRRRLVQTLEGYSLWDANFSSLVVPVVGEMTEPFLGLTKETFEELAENIDAICHSGALVDWMRPLGDYVRPNIVSTHELLRLASRGRAKAVHVISTISTLPKHMGLGLTEADQEYGYGTSKYVAEQLVAAARWRGAKASVYRLPYVTASATTGHFRSDRGDFLHNLISGSVEIGVFPDVDANMSAVLPVDYLSKTIVTIMAEDMHRLDRDYDFLNSRALSCRAFFEMISTLTGVKGVVHFDIWKQRALEHAFTNQMSPLARISAVIDGYTSKNAVSMFKGEARVGKYVLGGDDYPLFLRDKDFISKYVSRIKNTL